MSLLFPLGMAALGALVPLLILYLLKQKRVDVEVPTNFLWARALEDLRASSLFQRLRSTILLVLQALAIMLFAFAAAGASLDLRLAERPRRVVVLLDRSASMKTADEGGRTRFEVAKQLAKDRADALHGADEMMLVGFDVRAEVICSFTADRERIAQVLDAQSARDLGTKAADALRLAVSFGQASMGFDTEVLILSDGAIDEELPAIPFPVTYSRIGRGGANQGIASVQVARAPGEPAQVFVRVENGSGDRVTRTLTLRRAGAMVDARSVVLEPLGGASAFFELPEMEGADPVVLSLELDGKDVLAADDVASFVLRPAVPRTGLLVADEPSIYLDPAKLQRLHPGLALVRVSAEEAAARLKGGDASIDFVCYDGVEPKELPNVPAQLWIDVIPPGSGLVRQGLQEFPIVIDWDRTHPTTARCQFDDVLVNEALKLAGFERTRTLIDSTGGPLALLAPVPGREVVVIAFSPAKSNFPLKLSWPLFLANTLDFLLNHVERAGEEPLAPTGAPLVVAGGRRAGVVTPSGTRAAVEPDARGRAAFAATYEAGVYHVTAEDAAGAAIDDPRAFALLDPAEVRVAPHDQIVVGGERLAAATGDLRRNLLLRDPLLLAALGLLLVEWALWCARR